jgi:hypothetical protein
VAFGPGRTDLPFLRSAGITGWLGPGLTVIEPL